VVTDLGYVWFALGIGLVVGLSYVCYWVAFYNPESRHKEVIATLVNRDNRTRKLLVDQMDRIPWEPVSVTARDGLILRGRYYHVRTGAPVHIQFHGYRGSGVRDFIVGSHIARQAGYNTLVVDQRSHGLSQGSTMTFGIRERYDCISWAKYAQEKFGSMTSVFLSGVSMGGATVLMAAELNLPGNVVGIIADCPFSAPAAIIGKICRDVHLPWFLVHPFMSLGALLFGGFRLGQASAVRAVGNAKCPVLLIHGTEDKYILPEMSEEIRSRCASECYLELFPGAGHGGSCLTDMGRYEKILRNFCGICLQRRDAP
jgi:alpha-beta hydrolase superfamily lysophospholipase